MKTAHLMALLALALLLAGCLPRKVAWSPDGTRALVQAGDGLRMMAADGTLSDVRLKEPGAMAWFPDGQRVVVATVEKFTAWADINKLLTQEEYNEITANADLLRAEALQYTGDWGQFQTSLGDKIQWHQSMNGYELAWIYLRDKHSAGLPEKIGDHWKDFQAIAMNATRLHVYEAAGDTWRPGPILATCLGDSVLEVRVSPSGKAVLYSVSVDHSSRNMDICHLYVVDAAGGKIPKLVAENASWYFDWSRDGRSALYARSDVANPGGSLVGGRVGSRQVFDETDHLSAELPGEQTLLTVAFNPLMAVRKLDGQRVLIAGNEVTLPATNDHEQTWNFFIFDPDKPNELRKLLAEHADKDPCWVEPSPDGKHIAVCLKDAHIGVIDTASGKLTLIEEKDGAQLDKPGGPIFPAWRNNQELSYVAPIAEPATKPVATMTNEDRKGDLVLFNIATGVKTNLDAKWPRATLEGFLSDQPPPKPAP